MYCSRCLLVAVLGSISCISAAVMLVTIFLFRLHKKTSGRLMIALSISDICQSTAVQLSYHWVANGVVGNNGVCDFQGFLFTFGDMGSCLSALVICIYTVSYGVFNKKFNTIHEIISYVFIFGISLLLASVQFGVPLKDNKPFFGPSGPWCWITEPYSIQRLVLQYLYLYIVFFILLAMYGFMAYKVYHVVKTPGADQSKQRNKLRNFLRKMAGYPAVFFIVFFPLGIVRLMGWANATIPDRFFTFALCMFSLNGFLNAFVYGITRKVITRYVWFLRSSGESNSNKVSSGTALEMTRSQSQSVTSVPTSITEL